MLFDEDDVAYRGFKMIATPTIILTNAQQVVRAVHAGYDPGMPQDVRRALAEVLGVELPEAASKKAERPNMALQLGRRMAERGLWDRALKYYRKAAEEEALPQAAQIELAEIHLEIGDKGKAATILDNLPEEIGKSERVGQLRDRLRKTTTSGTRQPPKVHR